MTIGELSKRTGVPSSTLRYWERVKVLPGAMRISGQRRYTADAVNLVEVLKLAQLSGFSLAEMRRLLHGFRPETPAAERWRTTFAISARFCGRRPESSMPCAGYSTAESGVNVST